MRHFALIFFAALLQGCVQTQSLQESVTDWWSNVVTHRSLSETIRNWAANNHLYAGTTSLWNPTGESVSVTLKGEDLFTNEGYGLSTNGDRLLRSFAAAVSGRAQAADLLLINSSEAASTNIKVPSLDASATTLGAHARLITQTSLEYFDPDSAALKSSTLLIVVGPSGSLVAEHVSFVISTQVGILSRYEKRHTIQLASADAKASSAARSDASAPLTNSISNVDKNTSKDSSTARPSISTLPPRATPVKREPPSEPDVEQMSKPQQSATSSAISSARSTPVERDETTEENEKPAAAQNDPSEIVSGSSNQVDEIGGIALDGTPKSSFVIASKEENHSLLRSFSLSSIPDYLTDDKGEHPLAKFATLDNGAPSPYDFALNYYRQPAHGSFGKYEFEFLPISISLSGKALEHSRLRLYPSEKTEAQLPSTVITGTSWAYEVGSTFIYRWKAAPNDHGIVGVEILAKKISEADQEQSSEFLLPAKIYYRSATNEIKAYDTSITVISQYVKKVRVL